MQKLLVAFVSVITLMGLVVPSSASAVGTHPRHSPLPPARRDSAEHPQPSPRFNHRDDPTRRDIAELPQPSHHFTPGDGDPTRRDNAEHPQPSRRFNHRDDDPTRRDDTGFPQPSPRFNHGRRHLERNSDRFARGLPPLPPARRNSARQPQPSPHFDHQQQGNGDSPSSNVQIQDTNGNSLGYLTDFHGMGQNLLVNYQPEAHTLSFQSNNVGDADFLGAYVSNADLGPKSPAFVYLTSAANNNPQALANIWSLVGNQLTATWVNSDGTTVPVHFCLSRAENAIVLAGNPCDFLSSCKEVEFFYISN